MRTSSNFLTMLLIAGCISSAKAQTITQEKAAQKAVSKLCATGVHPVHIEMSGNVPLLYIFNADNEQKFAVISGSENVRNLILAYSLNDSVDWEKAPEQFVNTIKNFANGISNFINEPQQKHPQKILKKQAATSDVEIVEPLIKAKWNQGWPYNLMCPLVDGQGTMTGCVQTAMAMVMHYYKWPKQPAGSLTYSYEWHDQILSTNLDDHMYDWESMLNEYTGEQTTENNMAVAQLMYDLGVANEADFGCYGTGADINKKRFIENFDYDRDMLEVAMKSCSVPYLEELLKSELREGRPILVGGGSSNGAHQFVCDGFDSDGFFHYNFGWSGNGNGYFLVTATGYDSYPTYLYNIKPNVGGKGKLTAMSKNDFIYKDGIFSCDLSYYCIGDTKSEYTIEIAIALKNKATGKIEYIIDDNCASRSTDEYRLVGTQLIQAEINAEDGEYEIYPVGRLDNGEWQQFVFSDLMQSHVDLTIKNGNKTFTNNDLKDPIDDGKVEVNGIIYILDHSNNTAAVSYKNERKNSYSGYISVPDTINYNGITYEVTAIDASAFENCTGLDSVHVGRRIRTIGIGAFGGSSIKSISFETGSELETIEGWAFNAARNLTRLELPSGVTTLGMCCMQSASSLQYISLPASVVNFSQYTIWLNENTDLRVFWDNPNDERIDLFQYYDASFDPKKCRLIVPDGTIEQYQCKVPWNLLTVISESDATDIQNLVATGKASNLNGNCYNALGQRTAPNSRGFRILNYKKIIFSK